MILLQQYFEIVKFTYNYKDGVECKPQCLHTAYTLIFTALWDQHIFLTVEDNQEFMLEHKR